MEWWRSLTGDDSRIEPGVVSSGGAQRGDGRRPRWLRRTLLPSLALVLAVTPGSAACGDNDDEGATRDTVPPNVVPEGAGAWESITVRATAHGREVAVPDTLLSRAAPLLTGRLLAAPEPPSSYGLDAPTATITYQGAARTRTILVGDPTFDRHGYYVQRQGDPRVFLVPADQLDPLLALVVAAPDGDVGHRLPATRSRPS